MSVTVFSMLLLYLSLFLFHLVLSDPNKVGIINGTDANIADYPWMVSIHEKIGGFICGGSLISSNWVITAGHCSHGLDIVNVGIGSNKTNDILVDVAEVIIHPNFTYKSDGSTVINDITLVRLNSPVSGANVAPIRLPEPDAAVQEGQDIIITGWGDTTGANELPSHLQIATINITSKELCTEAFKELGRIVDKEGEFCGGKIGDTKGVCHGDSGGPAEINGTLIGITSWSLYGCAIWKEPSVFVNVSHYTNWIRNVTGI